jgi:hypothetical protein
VISISNELNKAHKEILKKKFIKEFTEVLMVKFQEQLKKSIQNQIKEHQDNTHKTLEKTQK